MASLLPFLRRSSGILRYAVNSNYPSCVRGMMSTATVTRSAPWLMLPPALDGRGNMSYTFYCLERREYLIKKKKINEPVFDVDDVKFVGSWHGWLAFSSWSDPKSLFLLSPATGRHIRLPCPPHTLFCTAPQRVVVSSPISEEEEEEEPMALMIFGSSGRGRLAFCRPGLSTEWTRMGELDDVYENMVYSSRHKRFFCICHENYTKDVVLEGWDVTGNCLTLEWAVEDGALEFQRSKFPGMSEFKKKCFQMNYLVCAEHSGELFLVVRHVNRRMGPDGKVIDKESRYLDCPYPYPDIKDVDWKEVDATDDGMSGVPYKTVDFDVYKIDTKTGEVMHMENWLQGLAMFVGTGHPLAIPAEAAGVKADCIYFSDENRLVEATRLEEVRQSNFGGHDNGIFDYESKEVSACCDLYPVEYHNIRKILPLPLWFTPTTINPSPSPSPLC